MFRKAVLPKSEMPILSLCTRSGALDNMQVNIELPNPSDPKKINFENGIIMLDSIFRR